MFKNNLDRIATAINKKHEHTGWTDIKTVLLGKGDTSNTLLVTNGQPRDVWVRDYNTHELLVVYCPPSALIKLVNGDPAQQNIEIRIGKPPRINRYWVMDAGTLGGVQAIGTASPFEAQVNQAYFPAVDRLQNLRARPTDPITTEIYVDGPYHYNTTTGVSKTFAGNSTASAASTLTSAIAALASGKHQIAWICLDTVNNVLVVVTNTASTAAGTLPSRGEFGDTDFDAISINTSYLRIVPVYLYYGQASNSIVEDDFYRAADARLGANNPIGSGGTVTSVTASAPLASSGGTTPNISLTGTVDEAHQASIYKLLCRVVAVSNVSTSSAPATIDGVTLTSGDRVLLTGQSTGNQNGIWVFNGAGSAMTRPTDFASGSTVQCFAGLQVDVYAGTTYKGVRWYCTTTGAITIDTTTTAWQSMFVNVGTVDAAGILPLNNGGTNVDLSASGGTTAILAQDGSHVISARNLVAADIPNLDASKITTGQLALARGGTHADLSATGPGALWQTSNGADVSSVEPVIVRVKNVSGATANANEVGLITYDSSNGDSYNTTTTANKDGNWCVVFVGGANNTDIFVAVRGLVTIKLNANCSIGDLLTTSTTAGQAAPNSLMRPEVFAVARTANSGGAGGTCVARLYCGTRFVEATNANRLLSVVGHSTTNFVATINGAPTATSVVYNAPSAGSDDVIVPQAGMWSKMRLYNTTRSSFRLISSVNTGTKTITTVSSTDSWANGDTIKIESQTVTTGAVYKAIELDLTQAVQTNVPLMARVLDLAISELDTAIGFFGGVVGFETWAISKLKATYNQAVSVYLTVPFKVKIINGVICWTSQANGTATANTLIDLQGWWEACP